MSTTTKNFGFTKPALTDAADITQMNRNWDLLDEQLQQMGEAASADSIIEQNNGDEQKFWVGTKAEYDAIRTKDPNTSYTVTDEVEEDTYLPLSGGAMTGMIKTNGLMLTYCKYYGENLPEDGQKGRVFFKEVNS